MKKYRKIETGEIITKIELAKEISVAVLAIVSVVATSVIWFAI